MPVLDGAHAEPFQVWVIEETVFHLAFAGRPVQETTRVSAAQTRKPGTGEAEHGERRAGGDGEAPW